LLACPNDPDDVKTLSDVAGTKIDEVFLGSCMTNIGHFRAAGKLLEQYQGELPTRLWVVPPTKMDQTQLVDDGYSVHLAKWEPELKCQVVHYVWEIRRVLPKVLL
jgi:aconitate hydratase 2/2-methylisocitrate dehydratase